jgi:colanic acid biosynthesis glycosyl transferase WcaI
MRFLFITQVFYPDTVSVSQQVSDLAFNLSKEGHCINVFTSRYPYEEKNCIYKSKENINGVMITRLYQTSFGKGNIISRIVDFLSFYCSVTIKLIFLERNKYDIIIGSTVPPLISFIGAITAKWKKIKFVYWIMDLQPELSISSGLIKKNSIPSLLFTYLGKYIFENSNKIISLDRFMTNYLRGCGVKNNIYTIPVWPASKELYQGSRLLNPFRIENNFGDKYVVMYSGNHAFTHPLETILNTALKLKFNTKFLFVFIGGGVRKKDVIDFKSKYLLDNIIQLPFQPRENIHFSLSSADIQVVILGEGQVGFTHPSKIYGAMYIGKPILYIGPKESHVMDILNKLEGNISVSHGESDLLAQQLSLLFSKTGNEIDKIGQANFNYAVQNFHPEVLKKKMVDAILE